MSNTNFPPPGTYLRTSRTVEFIDREHGRYLLRADCEKYIESGSYVKSELAYDIANNDGKLEWAPRGVKNPVTPPAEATHVKAPSRDIPAGTYLLTSENVRMVDRPEGRKRLEADCTKLDGTVVHSTLDFDIVNCDGVLMWDPHGKHVDAMYARIGPKSK